MEKQFQLDSESDQIGAKTDDQLEKYQSKLDGFYLKKKNKVRESNRGNVNNDKNFEDNDTAKQEENLVHEEAEHLQKEKDKLKENEVNALEKRMDKQYLTNQFAQEKMAKEEEQRLKLAMEGMQKPNEAEAKEEQQLEDVGKDLRDDREDARELESDISELKAKLDKF